MWTMSRPNFGLGEPSDRIEGDLQSEGAIEHSGAAVSRLLPRLAGNSVSIGERDRPGRSGRRLADRSGRTDAEPARVPTTRPSVFDPRPSTAGESPVPRKSIESFRSDLLADRDENP